MFNFLKQDWLSRRWAWQRCWLIVIITEFSIGQKIFLGTAFSAIMIWSYLTNGLREAGILFGIFFGLEMTFRLAIDIPAYIDMKYDSLRRTKKCMKE